MWKSLLLALTLLAVSLPAAAQTWSFGAGVGPFIFGDFVTRTNRLGNETESTTVRSTLSAATRAGVDVNFERAFSEAIALRLDGSFTHAPLKVKSRTGNSGVTLTAGTMNVTTVSLPLVWRINHHGAFRFHVMAGPAWAMYDAEPRRGTPNNGVFEGTRNRWGLAAGGGVSWWLRDRFALTGELADVYTSSPFERTDLPALTNGVDIPRTHNVHTSVGFRYRF